MCFAERNEPIKPFIYSFMHSFTCLLYNSVGSMEASTTTQIKRDCDTEDPGRKCTQRRQRFHWQVTSRALDQIRSLTHSPAANHCSWRSSSPVVTGFYPPVRILRNVGPQSAIDPVGLGLLAAALLWATKCCFSIQLRTCIVIVISKTVSQSVALILKTERTTI